MVKPTLLLSSSLLALVLGSFTLRSSSPRQVSAPLTSHTFVRRQMMMVGGSSVGAFVVALHTQYGVVVCGMGNSSNAVAHAQH